MLHRRPTVAALVADRPDDLLVVSSLGSPTWDLAAAGDHHRNFCLSGTMGQAVPFALGLAMARPDRRVLSLCGDGELLMSLGILATIALRAPSNLAIAVLDNRAYHETGDQPTATAGPTDLSEVARACGFPDTGTVADEAALAAAVADLLAAPGPVLRTIEIVTEDLPLVLPHSLDGVTAINRFRRAATP